MERLTHTKLVVWDRLQSAFSRRVLGGKYRTITEQTDTSDSLSSEIRPKIDRNQEGVKGGSWLA